ncbi:hypothetical protein Ga0080574_TMP1640 [Salipiger abyssi]|uniref:Uncharacterized protein n=1 Tax=Salipiger abyssi TaxID=1250539 RepID=A0A1P8URC5_9RHOB|nr:hypothetical protein Ga0080574_TMP1640 [Salipiger abyssi]
MPQLWHSARRQARGGSAASGCNAGRMRAYWGICQKPQGERP